MTVVPVLVVNDVTFVFVIEDDAFALIVDDIFADIAKE